MIGRSIFTEGSIKLLHCIHCGDVVRLYTEERRCHCGLSRGRYIDDERVLLWGPCRAIGVDTGEWQRSDHGAWRQSDRVVRTGDPCPT